MTKAEIIQHRILIIQELRNEIRKLQIENVHDRERSRKSPVAIARKAVLAMTPEQRSTYQLYVGKKYKAYEALEIVLGKTWHVNH